MKPGGRKGGTICTRMNSGGESFSCELYTTSGYITHFLGTCGFQEVPGESEQMTQEKVGHDYEGSAESEPPLYLPEQVY